MVLPAAMEHVRATLGEALAWTPGIYCPLGVRCKRGGNGTPRNFKLTLNVEPEPNPGRGFSIVVSAPVGRGVFVVRAAFFLKGASGSSHFDCAHEVAIAPHGANTAVVIAVTVVNIITTVAPGVLMYAENMTLGGIVDRIRRGVENAVARGRA